MASVKCQQCNNPTRNPSGLCHIHEGRGKSQGMPGMASLSAVPPSMSADQTPGKRKPVGRQMRGKTGRTIVTEEKGSRKESGAEVRSSQDIFPSIRNDADKVPIPTGPVPGRGKNNAQRVAPRRGSAEDRAERVMDNYISPEFDRQYSELRQQRPDAKWTYDPSNGNVAALRFANGTSKHAAMLVYLDKQDFEETEEFYDNDHISERPGEEPLDDES